MIDHGMDARELDCDRFGRFACANEVWEIPKDIVPTEESDGEFAFLSEISAAARPSGGRSGAAWRASGASSVCACALLGGWGLWLGALALLRPRSVRSSGAKAALQRRRRETPADARGVGATRGTRDGQSVFR